MGVVFGTSPESGALNVTEVDVTLATVAPLGMLFVPLTNMPLITPAVARKGRVAPEGVSPLVGSDSGMATGASQVEIGDSFRSSLRYVTGPTGDEQGGGIQFVSAPSGLTG